MPPPHSTGGAVDLRLVRDDGAPLDHYSPYPNRDTRSYAFDAPGLSDEARRTRSILKEALEGSGMTNYPAEYWHWTYGDQGWAYRGRHAHAIYGAIVPDGWEPAAADVSDDPLVWVYEDKESA
ncbi:MAG: hypothetical protein HY248_00835 [Fimbriimonas ginsengisoli]|nr:hypothetical protein [Fimbriimonas ginsengisoli]